MVNGTGKNYTTRCRIVRTVLFCIIFFGQQRGALALENEGNWLFIGDSHSVRGFGDGLRETLFQSKLVSESHFYQYSISGSTVAHWMDGSFRRLRVNWAKKTPGKVKEVVQGRVSEDFHPFPNLNRELNPLQIIIALGTNDSSAFARDLKNLGAEKMKNPIASEQLLGSSLSYFKNLLEVNLQARCAVILPPKLKLKSVPENLHQKFTDGIKKIAESRGCLIIDSRIINNQIPNKEITSWNDCLISPGSVSLHPDQPDGVHFFKTKGEYWGKCAALLIQESWK